MSEYRADPASGDWVLLSDERAKRPMAVATPPRLPPSDPADCPFCPGNESRTGPAIASRGEARVVVNRFPALRVEADGSRFGAGSMEGRTGLGAHEVVIETADHDQQLADLSDSALGDVVTLWRDRVEDLYRDRRMAYVQVYKNHEAYAGATLAHAHSQVLASCVVPPRPARIWDRHRAHHERSDECLRVRMIADALRGRERVALERDGVLAISPWASRVPFETVVTPASHSPRIETSTPANLAAVASVLGTVLRRIRVALDDPAYTLVLDTPPPDLADGAGHWTITVLPRLTSPAGYEWASGTWINPTRPSDAAAALRALDDVR